MSDTTDRGYPYPQEDDPIAVHTDIQALAEAVDEDVQQLADDVEQLAEDADGHFVLDEDNTATGSNQFNGETTFNDGVFINPASGGVHIIKGDAILGNGADQIDYRGAISNGPNLVNKSYVDAADADLQQAIDRLEGITHRAEWVLRPINTADPVEAGEMTWRDPGGMGWSGVMQVRINHEDLGGRVHPMGTVQEGNLFLIEYADENDVIQGSAVYIVGQIRSNIEWIDFDPASMIHATGQPPQIDSDQVMKLVFTPADSGSGDYWTKAESDGRYLAKGTSTALQLNNGSTLPQTAYIGKGNNTNVQLADGSTKPQSDFAGAHSHPYASSSHNHDTRYHAKYTGSDASTKKRLVQNDHSTVANDFAKGPVRFSVSGSALYWYNQ